FMNISYCQAIKIIPYALVFDQDPYCYFSLLEELKHQGFENEEDLPESFTNALEEKAREMRQEDDVDNQDTNAQTQAEQDMANQTKNVHQTTHYFVRALANANLEHYPHNLEREMVARNHHKHPLNYKKNDLVILAIPKIDRSNTDPTLPCKIIEKLSSGNIRNAANLQAMAATQEQNIVVLAHMIHINVDVKKLKYHPARMSTDNLASQIDDDKLGFILSECLAQLSTSYPQTNQTSLTFHNSAIL
ncbi:9575_t:CDS:2, partial [Ambispora leptoticha]